MIAVEFSEGLENFYNAEIDAILLRTVGAWCSNQPKSYNAAAHGTAAHVISGYLHSKRLLCGQE